MSAAGAYDGPPLRVMITTAYQKDGPFRTFRRAAELDRFCRHSVTDRAEDADIILFVQGSPWRTDIYFRKLLGHSLVRRFPEKCFMYNDIDGPWTVLPGLYCSMSRSTFSTSRHRACTYLSEPNPWIVRNMGETPDLLFSFMGRQSDPIRTRLLELRHGRGYLLDTSGVHQQWGRQDQGAMKTYADIITRSKFVLCPRGRGPASYRLFETMRAGRVPVIISDEWVAPEGPDWDACSIRMAEGDIAAIPAILEAAESRWPAMAEAAAREWDDWFAPDVLFTRMVDDCAVLLERRRIPERWRRLVPDRLFLTMRAKAAVNRVQRRFPASPGPRRHS